MKRDQISNNRNFVFIKVSIFKVKNNNHIDCNDYKNIFMNALNIELILTFDY
jgi:hypothetical protein